MTFRIGEQVGTCHGPGRIVGIERHEIEGASIELFTIDLRKSRLLVPVDRAEALRPLSTLAVIADVLTLLGTRPKAARGPWYAAALKYERKVHSGDILTVASVVRDLHRVGSDIGSAPERLYRIAFDLLSQEIAVVEELSADEASAKIVIALSEQTVLQAKARGEDL
jgi:CarD family transcriptional regulator